MNCSICNNKIDDKFGHNAEPVNNGRCCNDCNYTVVLPARVNALTVRIKEIEEMSND